MNRYPVPHDLVDCGKGIEALDVGEAHFERASMEGMAMMMPKLRGWKQITKRVLLIRAGEGGFWVWRAL